MSKIHYAGVVEANSIHYMSMPMAQSAHSGILKDCMAIYIQGKEFFNQELQSQISENLGKALLSQTKINVVLLGAEACGKRSGKFKYCQIFGKQFGRF
jgi:hypothetical protein